MPELQEHAVGKMTPLTITLPPEVFAQVVSGGKKIIRSLRNPKRDRWLTRWKFTAARINGIVFPISKTEKTETEWRLYL